ncbi:MAG: hypothetical protein HW380_555 [Magnetococcales bacterium]|nr:hypothetical protein [Magnetococcales bacterium]
MENNTEFFSDRVTFVGYRKSTFDSDVYRNALHSKNQKAGDLSTDMMVDEIRLMDAEEETAEFSKIMKNSPFVVTTRS